MSHKPTLEEWNWHHLMLDRALIGAISANFRMISLRFVNEAWQIEVVLETDSCEDEDEINDVADEMSIFLMDVQQHISKKSCKTITSKIIVSDKVLQVQNSDDVRVLFKRREPTSSISSM